MNSRLVSCCGRFVRHVPLAGLAATLLEQVLDSIEYGVAAAAAYLALRRIDLVGMQSKDGFACGALGIHEWDWVRNRRDMCVYSPKVDKLAYFARASKFSPARG